jgi:hypothetical protein
MDLTTNRPVTSLFNVPLSGVANGVPDPAPVEQLTPGAAVAPTQAQPAQPQAPKKHGTIHNILSTLGDFLLEQTGLSDIIKNRRLNESLQGFDQDPLGTINKVSGIDYAVGAKLRDQYIDNQRLAASQASTQESREARLALAQTAQNDKTRGRAAAMLSTMSRWDEDKRGANYGVLRDQVLKYGQANGLDLSKELPDSYDGTLLDSFIDQAVPVGMQRAQRLTEQKMEDTNEYRTNSLGEKVRHNQSTEDISRSRVSETGRHNGVTEGQGSARIGETVRHNTAAERIALQKDATSRRGQDKRDITTRRGQDIKFVPDPNKVYIQNGKRFKYDAATKTYKAI